jgi:hypothetical protein
VTLAVVVVSHPARSDAALHLAAELGGALVVDDGRGEWATHERALEWAAGQRASHALVVQDDAVPVPRMIDHAAAAVDAYPGGPIGLYVGRSRPRPGQVERAVVEAEKHGASWLEADSLLWGVATILPSGDLPGMLEWCSRSALPYDQRVGSWYRRASRPVRYTWPSLVDHADGPSLIPGRPRREPRTAWRVGSPTSWDGPIVRIGARSQAAA